MLVENNGKNKLRPVGTQCDYNLNRLKSPHIPSLTAEYSGELI
jgi:hypothetical protein